MGNENNMYTLEELLELIKSRLGGFGKLLLIPVVVVYLLTGAFIVGPDEEAVLFLFGKYQKTAGPGINWYFPQPIASRIKVKTTKVYRIEVGFRTVSSGPPAKYKDMKEESLILTGDENILDVDFSVQYKVTDLKKFLFNMIDPYKTIKDAAEASMRQTVGKFNIDETLTEGKSNIQIQTRDKLQEILNKYDSGITVLNVQLQDVQPPEEVIQAFKDVASAREDKIRYINEANGYMNDIIPKARGEAFKVLNDAEAYKGKRTKEAQGDVVRFLKLYENYKLGKEVTKTRLYLENLERNLKDVDKVIIDSDVKNGVLNLIQEGGKTDEKNN
jgi:membrane protease subunit HflK